MTGGRGHACFDGLTHAALLPNLRVRAPACNSQCAALTTDPLSAAPTPIEATETARMASTHIAAKEHLGQMHAHPSAGSRCPWGHRPRPGPYVKNATENVRLGAFSEEL